MARYQERFYRTQTASPGWASFTARVKESDLWIKARRDLAAEAYRSLFRHRYAVEEYIRQHPVFEESLAPLPPDPLAPLLIREMLEAGRRTGVGPMAAVAGAIAERVGRDLLAYSPEVIVENGGDLFVASREPVTVGLYAGASPLSRRIGIAFPERLEPFGLCTSSGTIGHSLSFGRADAVAVLSPSAALSDAAATAIANRIRDRRDISGAIEQAKELSGLEGVLIVVGDQLGVWGQMEIVTL